MKLGSGRREELEFYVRHSGRAAVALDVYLRDSRPAFAESAREHALFLSKHGSRLSQTQLQSVVVQHARAAGVPTRTAPHTLRHACATHLLEGAADVRHVEAILGHRCLERTALYTHIRVKALAKVIERSHPRERVE